MRTIKMTFILLLVTQLKLSAQYTQIPDQNFEKTLIDLGYDTGPLDHQVLTINIRDITSLNVSDKRIHSLIGIEDFTSLTELWCYKNQLTSLDISKNTALISVWCSSNQLSYLDTSRNKNLTKLWCSVNQLKTLDISNNTSLTALSCRNNQLYNLDISKNSALRALSCSNNLSKSIDHTNNLALAGAN